MSIHVKFTPTEAKAIREALEAGDIDIDAAAASALAKIEKVIEQLGPDNPDDKEDKYEDT